MGRLVVSENTTLDGVTQDPLGEEGFVHGGWFTDIPVPDSAAWAELACEEVLTAEAVLVGRRSYESFAARWQTRTGVFADRINTMPKYVVSSTLRRPDWANTTVLTGELPGSVADLTSRLDGDIVVYASARLVRVLLAHGLVDELRVTIFPFMLGCGDRLLDTDTDTGARALRQISNRTLGDGLTHVRYEVLPR